MSRVRRDRAAHGGLRVRLVAAFAALAAVLCLSIGWAVVREVRSSLDRFDRSEVESLLAAIGHEIESIGELLSGGLSRLEPVAGRLDPRHAAVLLAGGAEAAGEARRMADRLQLDLLTVLDGTSTVLSSAHWPELAGLAEPSPADCPDGAPVVRRVDGPEGATLAIVMQRPMRIGERPIRIVAGRRLDDRFAKGVGRGTQMALYDLEPSRPTSTALEGTPRPLVGRWRELALSGPAQPSIVPRPEGGEWASWTFGRYPLRDEEGRVLGAIVVARRATLAGMPDRLLRVFLIAGGAAVLLSALIGLWVARLVARPVDRLVSAVDAIAAGEADYSHPEPSGHELDRLAQSFSRLQRSLEQQQRRSAAAERVAAWREVARRVAHEVKNPLAPIRLTVENLTRARERDPRLFDELFEEGVRTILDEVEQLRRLVTEFSEFARLPAPRWQEVDLHEEIEGALDLHAASPELEIVRRFDPRSAVVEADPDQLARALKNVVGNAIDAMADNDGPRRLEVGTSFGEDASVTIRICDNGPGLSAEAGRRMFEPYYTTKAGGTGLGMAITYGIITDHGGEIEVDNRAEGGLCVRIRLKAQAARAAPDGAGA